MLNYSANGPSGYNLTNSLRFRSSASAFLSRTPSVTGNRRTWTWSAWVKRGSLGSAQVLFGAGLNNGVNADELVSISFTANDQLQHYVVETGVTDRNNTSTAVYRDPSAWYHIVAIYDSTQATASNRQRLFVNGVEITAWSSTGYVNQNYQPSVNSNAYPHAIGKYGFNNTRYFDGYMDEINFIDGQALTPSSFGSTNSITGVWQPAKYTGTYGTNGFYLNFTDIALTSGSNTGLGRDFSGNGNFWNTNNISVTSGVTYDAMSDVPTLTSATVANYAVGNPINNSASGNITFSQANLALTIGVTFQWRTATATMSVPSGKWYWEVTKTNSTTSGDAMVGIVADTVNISGNHDPAKSALGYAYLDNGQKANNSTPVSYGATWTLNDVIGIAFDADTGQLTFYKNGVSQGVAYTVTSGHSYYPAFGGATTVPSYAINFGQRPFAYTPPTGFKALNAFNLPTSTIIKGNTVMDATLYTGNGVNAPNALSITNAGAFQPDLVWIKLRSGADIHNLQDSVIGTSYRLSTNNANSLSATGGGDVSSFNSNGFTISYNNNWTNANGSTYVAWQWKANGSSVTNTAGTITTTVNSNPTVGFSVVTFGGNGVASTVGHGLGVAPTFIITKGLSLPTDWIVYHKYLNATPQNYGIVLNGAGTPIATATYWNNTAPTSTVYSVGSQGNTNANAGGQVSYCFTDIQGYSKFGSYTGNGSADGAFVYCGFRPAFVLLKNISTTDSWLIKDDQRAANYNPANGNLYPNLNLAEDTGSGANIDFLSNGFKIRGSNISVSGNGNTIIYAAFAENPFKNALAR